MKATIVIDDGLLARVEQEAAKRKSTISAIIESALRETLDRKPSGKPLKPLPTFDSGGALVDIANRDALYEAMEGGPVHD